MRATTSLYTMNRGVVSRLGLARLDVKRVAMAAQVQTNFMPRVLGSMMLRPGLKYLGSIAGTFPARLLKFIFATYDTAILEMTPTVMRVWMSDVLLSRPSVATAITNGTFAGSLAGWTQMDEAGATSDWFANTMEMYSDGNAYAIREQQVAVAGGDVGVEHGVRITILRGPVTLRIGSTSGGDEYVAETTLLTGTHSLSFTPSGNFYVRFFSRLQRRVYVQNCTIEAAGVVSIPTPYGLGDLSKLRTDQSGDVVFVACAGRQQMRIERRGARPNARSWSIVTYAPDNGPFNVLNVTPTTITPSGLTGNITLTASRPIFRLGHLGALFSLTSIGQNVIVTGSANGVFTKSIRVTGVGDDRGFSIIITGDASGSTVNLQRSYDNVSWTNVSGAGFPITANTSVTYTDALANQIVFYRLFLTTRVAPDNVTMQLGIGSGNVRGVARLTVVAADGLTASGEVLSDMGATTATTDWQEGMWSDVRGWPTSGKFHEGRLWWFGQNGIWGSISDAFDSFDETFIGNAGPINRTIGSGPVDTINWGLSLKGLMVGAQGAEFSVRASSLDEPLTPTTFNVKCPSTQGSAPVDAIKIDMNGYFVNRSATKIMELSFDLRSYDFQATNLMELAPDIGKPGIVRMDGQRLPDTRIHCVKVDGSALVAVVSKSEEVLAWIPIATDGLIEDVLTLPALNGDLDDQVYYVVHRTINGQSKRYLEKWAQEIDCFGDKPYCHLADAYIEYSGAPTMVIGGLSHLEGKRVVVWADGHDVGTDDSARPWTQRYTVAGGQIVLSAAASAVVVGLGYTAQYQSAKLGLVTQQNTPLNQQKRIDHVGLILANAHPKGLKYGPTLDDTGSMRMDDMPAIERGTDVGDATRADYDENLIEFPGSWVTDMRVCVQAQAPRPVTVMAISISEQQNT